MEAQKAQLIEACSRILSSETRLTKRPRQSLTWSELISKITILDSSSGFQETSLRSLLFQFALKDLNSYSQLIIEWSWHEFTNAKEGELGELGVTENYRVGMRKLIEEYLQLIQEDDVALLEVLNGVPVILEEFLEKLELICTESLKYNAGLKIIKSIALHRVKLRIQSLKLLIKFSLSLDQELRLLSISTLTDIYHSHHVITSYLQTFTKENLSFLINTSIQEQDNELEQNIIHRIELYLNLCAKDNDLLMDIFNLFPQLDSKVQELLLKLMEEKAAMFNKQHLVFIHLVCQPPNGAQDLSLKGLLGFIKEKEKEDLLPLLNELIKTFESNASTLKLILPILKYYEKEQLESIISQLIYYLSQGELKDTFNIFSIIIKDQLMSVEQVICLLHDPKLEINKMGVIKALKICLKDNVNYTPNLIMDSIIKLLDFKKLPLFFMRTVLELLKLYPENKQILNWTPSLLMKLVQKKIYLMPTLFEGFIMVCNIIGNSSHPILLQLPREPLEKVLKQSNTLKQALTLRVQQHLKSNPDTKQRLKDLLPLFEIDQ
ncbi:hypothetical protein K502DRAFT_323700 [Neoconidiobolus thromboides FSU 785]|nr:hypothetical protein K502DRAFT_323700 [Neoconidiobolus thromboides FSU 785]